MLLPLLFRLDTLVVFLPQHFSNRAAVGIGLRVAAFFGRSLQSREKQNYNPRRDSKEQLPL